MKWSSLALAAALSVGLAGCASMPPAERARAEFLRSQDAAATHAERADNLALALNLRQSMLTMAPDDTDTQAAIERLQALISQRSAAAIKRGKAAYARGNGSEGDNWMLRALALQPGEPTALAGLRQQATRRAQAQAKAQTLQQNVRKIQQAHSDPR